MDATQVWGVEESNRDAYCGGICTRALRRQHTQTPAHSTKRVLVRQSGGRELRGCKSSCEARPRHRHRSRHLAPAGVTQGEGDGATCASLTRFRQSHNCRMCLGPHSVTAASVSPDGDPGPSAARSLQADGLVPIKSLSSALTCRALPDSALARVCLPFSHLPTARPDLSKAAVHLSPCSVRLSSNSARCTPT